MTPGDFNRYHTGIDLYGTRYIESTYTKFQMFIFHYFYNLHFTLCYY